MAIKSRLEKSAFILFCFHWTWISGVFFMLDVFHIKARLFKLGYDEVDLNNFTLLSAQITITKDWILHTLPFVTITCTIAFALSWIGAWVLDIKRTNRKKGRGEFRGMSVTIGNLPMPKRMTFESVEIKLPLKKFPKLHFTLFKDILSLCNSKEVPAGVGHPNTLFEHTINVINKALEINITSPNSLCAIAAHDIGKIEAFVKKNGEWTVEGLHDEIGAAMIAKLPSWWDLNEKDRNIIYFAVKYSHKPDKVPSIIPNREDICKTIEDIRHVDHNVTGEEKEESVNDIEKESTLLEIFMEFLQNTPIRTSSTPPGLKTGGWVKHDHLFILENYFKDVYLKENHPQVLAAYNELQSKVRFSRITKELLKQLNQAGLLVKKWNGEKITRTNEALWVIAANKMRFTKIIIIPLTEEIHSLVGNDTYHKGLVVESSYGAYFRQMQRENNPKPKAKLNAKSSTQRKVAEDVRALKEQKTDVAETTDSPIKDTQTKAEKQDHAKKSATDKSGSNPHAESRGNGKNNHKQAGKHQNRRRRTNRKQDRAPENPMDLGDDIGASMLSPLGDNNNIQKRSAKIDKKTSRTIKHLPIVYCDANDYISIVEATSLLLEKNAPKERASESPQPTGTELDLDRLKDISLPF